MGALVKNMQILANEHPLKFCGHFVQKPNFASTVKHLGPFVTSLMQRFCKAINGAR